jgi:hypothetical protein
VFECSLGYLEPLPGEFDTSLAVTADERFGAVCKKLVPRPYDGLLLVERAVTVLLRARARPYEKQKYCKNQCADR